MLIGLCGYARSGKDTVGDILNEHYGYEKFSFADPIRELARQANPIVSYQVDETGVINPVRYNEAVAQHGYDDAKEKVPEVRKFLQNLGLGAREVLGQSVWVNTVMKRVMPEDKLVNVSTRFFDEEVAIRSFGGKIILITRPGYGPVNDHVTERFASEVEPDCEIENDGTKEDLRAKIETLVKNLEADW